MRLGKCVSYRVGKGRLIADLLNRLQCCCHVGAIVAQYGCVRADLRKARWSIDIGAEVVVEAPRADLFAESKHLRCVSRISKLGHHAVEGRELISEHFPLTVGSP